jgi:hypothetical protein
MTEVLGDVTAQVITDEIGIPVCPAPHVLHRVRRHIDDQTMAAVINHSRPVRAAAGQARRR